MTTIDAVRQLHAFAYGQPVPRGQTLQLPLDPAQTLLLAWCRMGGESRPWGVAWQEPGREPQVRTVAEPRDPAAVATMLMELAPVMLRHFGFPFLAGPNHPMPQLWLPNPTHFEMLRFIAFTYTFAARNDAAAWPLRALGRLAGFLTRDAARMPSMATIVATDALRAAFTFPAQPVRQQHLGFLLAWLTTTGPIADRFAAAIQAEQEPIATSLTSEFERDELMPRVQAFNDAKRNRKTVTESKLAREIHVALAPKLLARLALTRAAMQRLVAESAHRPINPGIAALISAFQIARQFDYLNHELRLGANEPGNAWAVAPETDRQLGAATVRFFTHNSAAGERADALLPHDADLQFEAIAAGTAIIGQITRVTDEGRGRKRIPVWQITGPACAPMRLREGQLLAVAAHPKRCGVLRRFTIDEQQQLHAEIEITANKLESDAANTTHRFAATDRRLIGTPVVLFAPSSHHFDQQKRKHVRAALSRAGFDFTDSSVDSSADSATD